MIIHLETVDSTNRYALRELERTFETCGSVPDNALVLANEQTGGRGRRGKSWYSPPGVNVYASFVMHKPSFALHASLWLSSLAGLSTLRAFAPEVDFWVKWPNDIYCVSIRRPGEHLKVAGLLAESFSGRASNRILAVVAGIGINVNMSPESCDSIDKPASSVLSETGRGSDIAKFAGYLHKELVRYRGVAERRPEEIRDAWVRENRLAGADVEIGLDAGEVIVGRAEGLSEAGELVVLTANGPRRVVTGDVLNFTFPA